MIGLIHVCLSGGPTLTLTTVLAGHKEGRVIDSRSSPIGRA